MSRGNTDIRERERFRQSVLPHIDAAHNLARWLMHNTQDAEDAVQDAFVRAFRYFDGFRGNDARAWLLRIVRNTCYSNLRQRRAEEPLVPLDETGELLAPNSNPETIVLQRLDIDRLKQILDELPIEFREVMVLRDMEGMSYRDIAEIVEIPIGTVMSRLARARRKIQDLLSLAEEPPVRISENEVRNGM